MRSGHLILLTLLSVCVTCSPPPATEPAKLLSGDCSLEFTLIEQAFARGKSPWKRSLSLPVTGKFVEESHYVTTEDSFGDKTWPASKNEGIQKHLQRSFRAYQKYAPKVSIEDLYHQSWQKEWTPEEGGHYGQGSVGVSQLQELSVEMEMWFLTMMWAKGTRPKKGTRFLLSANGRNVVVQAGFETGPASENFVGGVTREVHYWLGSSSKSDITIARLKNQTIPLGPVDCR